MAKRRLQLGLFLAVVLGSFIAVGCGSDEVATEPPGERGLDINIRNGTWALAESVTFIGSDSCIALPYEIINSTDTLCRFDPADVPLQFRFECDADTMGSNVDFVCKITSDLDICLLITDITGTGTITDTFWDLEVKLSTRVEVGNGVTQEDCDLLYGNFASVCTTMIFSTGTWISSDGDSVCPDFGDTLQAVPLEALITRGAATDLWRQ